MKKRRFRRDAPLLGMAGRLIGAGVAVCLALAVEQANAQGAPQGPPDLVVQGTAVSDRTLAPGQAFNFWAAVYNDDGDDVGGDAAATTLCYYRSDDTTLNPPVNPPSTPPEPLDGAPACPNPPMGTFDDRVGTDAVRAINWSSAFNREDLTSQEDIQLTAPAMVGADYYYYACVAPVANESNVDTVSNCSATTYQEAVRVLVGDEPDLAAEGPSVSDDILGPGQSFNFRVGVFNHGNGDSTATTLRYYLSEDSTLTRTGPNADEALGTDPVPALDAGGWPAPQPEIDTLESSRSRQVIELTAPTTMGFYHYFACVDVLASEQGTTRANNNCISIQVEVAGGPDLVIESPRASATDLLLEDAFTFSATVVNLGDAVADATTLRYYRSTDATISTEDVQVGTDAVVQLDPGNTSPRPSAAESREDIDLNAPDSIGTYYYYACVDDVAGELVTGNNCTASIEVSVRGGPDLQVKSASVSRNTLGPGQSFTFNATVINGGDVRSSATKLRYYRSEDDIISNEDARVGEETDVDALAPAAESLQGIALDAPRRLATYYYGACVVAVRTETVVSNNCSLAVRVEVTEQPADLVVQNIAVTDFTLNTGQSFNLSADVVNVGGDHAAASVLRYYRSDGSNIDKVGTDPVREIRYSITFVPRGEDLTSQEDIQLTAPRSEGVYHYYACVGAPKWWDDYSPPNPIPPLACDDDLFAVPGEVNYMNNRSELVHVLVGDNPNLTAEGPSITTGAGVGGIPNNSEPREDTIVGAGQTFEFGVGVVNRGDGDSPKTTLRHYFSPNELNPGCVVGRTWVGETIEVPELPANFRPSDTRFQPSEYPEEVHEDSKVRLETRLTAPTEVGRYCYGACVAEVKGESDNSDNCTTDGGRFGVRIEVTEGPDLEVGAVVDRDRRLPGERFRLTATVTNYGRAGSPAVTLRYYRSADPIISDEDDEVGMDPVEELAPQNSALRNRPAESEQYINLNAPNDPGVYYYGGCVEILTGELNTENNCSQGVRVTVNSGPDLVVKDLAVVSGAAPDGVLLAGRPFSLTARVVNEGDVDFSATMLRFRLLDSPQAPSSGEEIGAVNVQADAASDKFSVALQAAPEGTRHYGACVDAVPNEVDTTNNCASISVRVSQGADLVIEPVRVDDDSLAPDQTFIFQASVVNEGDRESAQTTLRYYRSADDRISRRDRLIGTDGIPSLNVVGRGIRWNASRSRQGIQLKASSEGTYYYGACVDSVGNESNANNNCSEAVRVTVSQNNRAGDPDLAVDASVSANDVAPGDAFTLRAQVWNYGDEASETTRLRYYRSTDAVISGAGDDLVLGAAVVEGIPKSDGDEASQSLHSLQVAAPNAPGTYYYGACVDPVAGDPDAKNNCSKGLRVVVGDNPGGEEGTGEGVDEAVQETLGSWRGWRSVLLRPPPVGDGDAS